MQRDGVYVPNTSPEWSVCVHTKHASAGTPAVYFLSILCHFVSFYGYIKRLRAGELLNSDITSEKPAWLLAIVPTAAPLTVQFTLWQVRYDVCLKQKKQADVVPCFNSN